MIGAMHIDENACLWMTKRNIATAIGVDYYQLTEPINEIFLSNKLPKTTSIMWLTKGKRIKYYHIEVAILLSLVFDSPKAKRFRESAKKQILIEDILAAMNNKVANA